MTACSLCPWRWFCIFACPEMNVIFDVIDQELKGEGK